MMNVDPMAAPLAQQGGWTQQQAQWAQEQGQLAQQQAEWVREQAQQAQQQADWAQQQAQLPPQQFAPQAFLNLPRTLSDQLRARHWDPSQRFRPLPILPGTSQQLVPQLFAPPHFGFPPPMPFNLLG